MNRDEKTVFVALVVTALLAAPMVWACGGAATMTCAWSDCSTDYAGDTTTCDPPDSGSAAGCDSGQSALVAGCEGVSPPEPATVESVPEESSGSDPLALISVSVKEPPQTRLSDLAQRAVASREHELGRFTLVSSFLL